MDGITPGGPRRPTHPQQNAQSPQQAPLKSTPEQAQNVQKVTIRFRIPKFLKKIIEKIKTFKYINSNGQLSVRFSAGLLALLMIFSVAIEIQAPTQTSKRYSIAEYEGKLIKAPNQIYAQKLALNTKTNALEYNKDYAASADIAGMTSGPKFAAAFNMDKDKTVVVSDPINNVNVSFKPEFGIDTPQQDKNRVVYPLKDINAKKVYTLRAGSVKEDIILDKYQKNDINLTYEVNSSDGTELRIEKDGSLAVYGVNTALLGNITTATDKDKALLDKARQNSQKTALLFTIPAPFIAQANHKKSPAKAWFELEGKNLTLHTANLDKATYPLSIDPSVYIESASKLMKGNNESNIDFDVDNELIQKSQTSGARIDEWTSTNNLSTPIWGQGTAVAGGYIYSAGGSGGNSISKSTYYTAGTFGAGTGGFVVPTGVTSITVKAWGAGGGGGAGSNTAGGLGGNGGGGGYAKAVLTTTPGETLDILVGTAGAKAAGNSNGGNGGGYSAVKRSATFLVQAGGGGGGGGTRGTAVGGAGGAGGAGQVADGTVSVAGSAGAGTSPQGGGGGRGTNAAAGAAGTAGTGGVAGSVGAANGGGNGAGFASSTCNTAVTNTQGGAGGTGAGGGGGLDTSTCSDGGGGGSGRFGGGGGGSTTSNNRGGGGGGGGSDLTTGSGMVQTAGSGVTPGNDIDADNNGAGLGGTGAITAAAATSAAAGGVVITYSVSGSSTVSTVSWAKFNTATNAIESPNPGAGACAGWCNDSVYNLPTALTDLSLVAYNGFLYAIGGATSAGTPQTTVYIAKIGANGEPQLWHPTGGTPVYWYTDTALSAARSKFAAVAYNNRMYILGGLTTSSTILSSNTVQYANINPTGTFGTWTSTGMQALTTARYGLSAQVYNDTLYAIGGDATFTGSPVTTVEYSKLNSDGTMNSWTSTSSLITSGRLTMGGSFSTIWAGYIYVAGGCTAVNGSGYCTTMASDVQLASINADGSLAEWNTIIGLDNTRIGHTLISWQGGLYRLGGCRTQNTSTGVCDDTVFDVDYGVINQTGEASTVATSVTSGAAPCSGGSPQGCDLPGISIIGNVLSGSAILNGYLYIWGGCATAASGCGTVSRGVIYTSIGSDGSLTSPASCGTWTAVDSYCYNTTSLPAGGVGAPGTAVFNGYIYSVGGFTSGGAVGNIYYSAPAADGTISAWSTASLTGIGATSVSYPFAFTRANPVAASSTPGNLYILGGCSAPGGIGCGSYADNVYKCTISTAGVPAACSENPGGTNQQLQIGIVPGDTQVGLGAMAGTVYANYIYLMGGLTPNQTDIKTTRYAKIDNNNNIVDATTGSGTGAWVESGNLTFFGRRRGSGFGYNGYLYVVGGYDGSSGGGGVLADIEFAKINVSDGSIGAWSVSSVNIDQRWGLTLRVSNSYAYVIGGCINGAAPTCAAAGQTDTVQTFQIYNNDSGAIKTFTAGNTLGVDRVGGSSTIMNGYIYYAGGCTAMNCSSLTNTTYYAPIDANGTVGSWSPGGNLPASLAWGKLVNAGGTLYYIGGQTGAATTTAVGTIYYTSGISSGNPTWNGTAATKGIGDTGSGAQARTQFGAAIWDNTLFITGGFNASGTAQATVYASPLLDSGGNITTNWPAATTSFSVARGAHTSVAYANNLYIIGGFDGTSYLSDVQYTQINLNSSTNRPDGTVDAWTYTSSLATPIRDAEGFAANGYIYLVGGRSAATTCTPRTMIAPVSANTTIATGNNPKGVGEWYETNVRYAGDRYGAAAVYYGGRLNLIGGGCSSSFVGSGDRMYYATVKAQPQVAKYSRMIDTDTDVFPTKWLLNGLDNSTGARWYMRYRSSTAAAAAWGQETNYGAVTLGTTGAYIPKDSGGTNTNFSRYHYMSVNIDSSQAFGFPEDVTRGPTITDLSLFFTADPSKRLIHGKTFIGGEQQPLDTPCNAANPNCL